MVVAPQVVQRHLVVPFVVVPFFLIGPVQTGQVGRVLFTFFGVVRCIAQVGVGVGISVGFDGFVVSRTQNLGVGAGGVMFLGYKKHTLFPLTPKKLAIEIRL